ncbi:hypothetical protein [Fulvivirga sediminis]|uniref:Uncharacterized protein n=1 Tax=Fulvivirga sediminis TaxID=2803949 RepID=A0A937F8M3_9BACT|nr:hypothetical protein [Fulvivirga sediminis]MBL3657181.1 hypothetical protein [Fulvivirga sediminis]
MISRFLFILLFSLAYRLLFSQNVEVTASKPYRAINALKNLYFYYNDQVISVKIGDKAIVIQKFDKQGNFKQQREYKDLPKTASIERIGEHNGSYYVFYSVWNSSKKQLDLFYREINFATGVLERESRKILTVIGKVADNFTLSSSRLLVRNHFDFQYSKDHSRLLIQYRRILKQKGDTNNHDVIGFEVFDRYFNQLFHAEVAMPYTKKMMDNLDYTVDRNGTPYVIAKVYNDETTDRSNSNKELPNYHIEILKIGAGQVTAKPIALESRFINSVAIFETSDSFMTGAGLYHNGTDRHDADGIFVFKIKKDGETLETFAYDIPSEVINAHVKSSIARKNRKKSEEEEVLSDMFFDIVRVMNDGSVLLVAEQYEERAIASAMNGSELLYPYYLYNSILAAKVSTDGSIAWINKVPKRQAGRRGRGSMSYQYFYQGDKHHFIYLDNPANADLTEDEVPSPVSNMGAGLLTDYYIDDASGDMKRINVFNSKDVANMKVTRVSPFKVIQLSEYEFFIEVNKRKKGNIMLKFRLDPDQN